MLDVGFWMLDGKVLGAGCLIRGPGSGFGVPKGRCAVSRTTKYDRVVGLAPPNVSVHDDWAREDRWEGTTLLR